MADIAALLAPRSVAVIGAAPEGQGLRGRILETILAHPYAGSVLPISRSHAEIQGLKAYATIGDAPGPVDLAVLIIPAKFVVDELKRCVEAGVKAAAIISSGFAEEPGETGVAMQAEIRRIARQSGMVVMGPNSEGFANLPLNLCPTFSPAVSPSDVPLLPKSANFGRVSVVAQSGGMGFSFFDRGRPKELAFNHIITTGNEAALETFDVAEYLIDDPTTDAVLMLIEDVKTPETFRRVAEKALKSGKPLIVNKIGQSEAGQRAAASHTAALAGSYAAFQAMARHYGLIEGRDLEEMVDLAQAFLTCRDRLPKGRRVAICTASGGGGGWLADACIAAGLEVPTLDDATRREIDKHLPPYGTSQNPIDGTAQAIHALGYTGMARMAVVSPVIDTVIVVMSGRAGARIADEREKFVALRKETDKPILPWSYTLPGAQAVETLAGAGYPLFTSMRNCVRAVDAMVEWRQARERASAVPSITATDASVQHSVAEALAGADAVMTETMAKPLLAMYGIPIPAGEQLVRNGEQAMAAAARIGGPVALKVQSPDVPHKTEAGAVALGVKGNAEVLAAYDRILDSVKRHARKARIQGVLVQPMAGPGREVILGINRDDKFGPMLMIGLGGVLVEILHDVALAPVPLDAASARALIARLKGARLLEAFRGQPAADVDALVDIMVKLSRLAADYADTIAEIDLNPVLVHPKGQGATIVDALIIKRKA